MLLFDPQLARAERLMEAIRVLLANPHPIIRSSLRLLLEREPGFHVIGEGANGREAILLAEFRRPEIVVLDINLPYLNLNGIATARDISSKYKECGIVFVSVHTDEGYVSEALNTGARGYVAGDAAQTDLVRAVYVVKGGGCFLSPIISTRLLESYARTHSRDWHFSESEKQVCCLLAAGYNEHEIATHLNTNFSRITVDCQTVIKTLLRIEELEVVVNSLRANRHLVQNA